MENFLVTKQNYACSTAKPTYTLYKLEYKWFGLKKSYKSFHIDDDFYLTCCFEDLNELLGKLVRHYYNIDKKNVEIVDKKGHLDYIRRNISVKFIEYSYKLNEKPTYYGESTIKQYLLIKKVKK